MGYRDISDHIKEMYDTEISHNVLTEITDRIIPDIKQWRNRRLDVMYCIVWMDAMHFKVREEGKVVHKALYNILGIDKDGHKQILGMYISESEGANFWLQVAISEGPCHPFRSNGATLKDRTMIRFFS